MKKSNEETEEWTTKPKKADQFDETIRCYCDKSVKVFPSTASRDRAIYVCHNHHKIENSDEYNKGCWFWSWEDELHKLKKCKMCDLYMKKHGWIKDPKSTTFSCKNGHELKIWNKKN